MKTLVSQTHLTFTLAPMAVSPEPAESGAAWLPADCISEIFATHLAKAVRFYAGQVSRAPSLPAHPITVTCGDSQVRLQALSTRDAVVRFGTPSLRATRDALERTGACVQARPGALSMAGPGGITIEFIEQSL
jgi:hypothetical protein